MTAIRRLSLVALATACLHLVFGAIVRISGSGMGCGNHWPKCYGYWFPPFSRPDLVVEVTHRYLASILLATVALMAAATLRRRHEPSVGGATLLRGRLLNGHMGHGAGVRPKTRVKNFGRRIATSSRA